MDNQNRNSKKQIAAWIEENCKLFHTAAERIWNNPEVSMEEFYACEQLTELLEKYGFIVEKNVVQMPTAFVAVWGEGNPVIGFSAEYDALPGLSQRNDCSFRSAVTENAPGHGCGHNLMGAAGIMAAVALSVRMEKEGIKGTIKVFGTPGEELCIGKTSMARAGWFRGVDSFLDWHPSHLNRAGACSTNAYFNAKYHFVGKTAHGNAPWFGRSALDGAMLMGHALELLREHIRPGTENAATTINYAFPDVGNSFPNVVPAKSVLWVIGRVKDAESAAEIMSRVDRCALGCAEATGTQVEIEQLTATHDLIPNLCLARVAEQNMNLMGVPIYTEMEQKMFKEIQHNMGVAESGCDSSVQEIQLGSQPVTDSSEYSWFAPLLLFNLALTPSEAVGWHNWATTLLAGSDHGKKVMDAAARILAATGYDLLTEPEIIRQAKAELSERLDGRTYETLMK